MMNSMTERDVREFSIDINLHEDHGPAYAAEYRSAYKGLGWNDDHGWEDFTDVDKMPDADRLYDEAFLCGVKAPVHVSVTIGGEVVYGPKPLEEWEPALAQAAVEAWLTSEASEG